MIRVSGMGMVNNNQYVKRSSFDGNIYISKITEEIKIESSNSWGFTRTVNHLSFWEIDTINLSGIPNPLPRRPEYPNIALRPSYSDMIREREVSYDTTFIQEEFMSRNLVVKSLGDHAGLGGVALFRRSKFSNLKMQMITGPAVEFNIFSYKDATDKQFRILYSPQFVWTKTYDPTPDGLDEFRNYKHELYLLFMMRKNWGEINAHVYGSQYLDRTQNYSIGASASISRNITQNLSIFASAGINYMQDQIYLPADGASNLDILTNQKEVNSAYNYNFRVGITISLGSIFNNVVNPRFGN
jgi:hypothetical protein